MLNSAEHEIFSAYNRKMPTIAGIFIFIIRENSCSATLIKKEYANVNDLRIIIRTNFMLSWIEHEKSFMTSGFRPAEPSYALPLQTE